MPGRDWAKPFKTLYWLQFMLEVWWIQCITSLVGLLRNSVNTGYLKSLQSISTAITPPFQTPKNHSKLWQWQFFHFPPRHLVNPDSRKLFLHPMDKPSFFPQAFDLSPEFPLEYQCSCFIPFHLISYIHNYRPCITTTWDFLQTNYFMSASTTQSVSLALILVSNNFSGSWLALSFQYLCRITWQGCYIISSC